MRAWVGVALACSTGAAVVACATVLLTPPPELAPSPPALARQPVPASVPPAVTTPAPVPPAKARPAALAAATPAPALPELDREEAIQYMQWMAEEGDPRSPALGGLKPRQGASTAELADPRQYAALEERQARELVQAYASGVQQIPEIRARIEAAAQSGERSVAELDEARAALEQLEGLQGRLEREAPQLLPDGEAATPPKD